MNARQINELALKARATGEFGELHMALRPYLEKFLLRAFNGRDGYHLQRYLDRILDNVPHSLEKWDPKVAPFRTFITGLAVMNKQNISRAIKTEQKLRASQCDVIGSLYPRQLTAEGERTNAILGNALGRAINRLRKNHPLFHSVFELDNAGFLDKDIASMLSIPRGTVKSRMNRARRQLGLYLADEGFDRPVDFERHDHPLGDRKKSSKVWEEE
ncbi:MAG: hypothetical protein ABIG96_03015 [Candidatus Micrarchaeota archaeon]